MLVNIDNPFWRKTQSDMLKIAKKIVTAEYIMGYSRNKNQTEGGGAGVDGISRGIKEITRVISRG